MSLPIGYVAKTTAANLWRNRLMTLAAILTVAVSLSLVGGAILLNQGVNRAAGEWRGGVQMLVFMSPTATPADVRVATGDLATDPDVKHAQYLDREASYKLYVSLVSGQALAGALSPATIPTVFRISLVNAADAHQVGAAVAELPGVQHIAYDQAGITEMLRVTGVLQDVIVGIAVILLLSAIVLILNTIRMAIFGRRREVTVMRLVGATNWFIRVPFMLEGLVEGLLGALVAAGVLYLLRDLVRRLIQHFQVTIIDEIVVTSHEAMLIQLLVVALGVVAGVVGSAFAVRRFLDV